MAFLKFLFFVAAVLGTAYGLQNDFALAVVCWGLAVIIASSTRPWMGWGVVVLSVLMLIAE